MPAPVDLSSAIITPSRPSNDGLRNGRFRAIFASLTSRERLRPRTLLQQSKFCVNSDFAKTMTGGRETHTHAHYNGATADRIIRFAFTGVTRHTKSHWRGCSIQVTEISSNSVLGSAQRYTYARCFRARAGGRAFNIPVAAIKTN